MNNILKRTDGGVGMRVLSEVERGYVAAIIDGEGTFHIHKQHLTPSLQLSNTSKVLIHWLKALLGGTTHRALVYGNQQPQFRWWMNGHQLLPLLEQIRPILIVKARAADLVLELLRGYEYRALRGQGYSLPTKERRRRASIRVRLAHINRRGLR